MEEVEDGGLKCVSGVGTLDVVKGSKGLWNVSSVLHGYMDTWIHGGWDRLWPVGY